MERHGPTFQAVLSVWVAGASPRYDAEKKLIGTRVRITIEYRPGEAYAREERAEVRVCEICEGNVTTAPTTPPPIEGARPGPGMLAQIVTSKNSDAVPL